jgi:hypothetical protein
MVYQWIVFILLVIGCIFVDERFWKENHHESFQKQPFFLKPSRIRTQPSKLNEQQSSDNQNLIEFDPKEHPHRRFNPLTGEFVLVSPHRTKRPWKGISMINFLFFRNNLFILFL